jgi:hypothetical protein
MKFLFSSAIIGASYPGFQTPFCFFYIIGLIVLSLNLLCCIMNRDLLLTIIVFPTCMNALVIYYVLMIPSIFF